MAWIRASSLKTDGTSAADSQKKQVERVENSILKSCSENNVFFTPVASALVQTSDSQKPSIPGNYFISF